VPALGDHQFSASQFLHFIIKTARHHPAQIIVSGKEAEIAHIPGIAGHGPALPCYMENFGGISDDAGIVFDFPEIDGINDFAVHLIHRNPDGRVSQFVLEFFLHPFQCLQVVFFQYPHLVADDPVESATFFQFSAYVDHFGQITEDDKSTGNFSNGRIDRYHRHLEIPSFAVPTDESLRISKPRMGLYSAFTERTITAAETPREDFMAVPPHYFGVIKSGDSLSGAVEEIDASVQIVSQNAVGEVIQERSECQANLEDGFQKAMLKEAYDALFNVITDAAEGLFSLSLRIRILFSGILYGPMDPGGRSGKVRTVFSRLITKRDDHLEGVFFDFIQCALLL